MTSDEFVFQTLLTSGLKGTKAGWPMGQVPPLPWFTYKRTKGGELYADDSNWSTLPRYEVDLYQKECGGAEESLEGALEKIGPYRLTETWITTESVWVTSYYVTCHQDTST